MEIPTPLLLFVRLAWAPRKTDCTAFAQAAVGATLNNSKGRTWFPLTPYSARAPCC
jgi:hypothetical protein